MDYPRPVLVGGAAVEFDTAAQVVTDFDFVTSHHEFFEQLLAQHGFVEAEKHPGWRMKTYFHPDFDTGVEVVSDRLYDGSDPARIRLVHIDGNRIALLPVEDLIADRVGQYADDERPEWLEQAIALLGVAYALDEAYLDGRIRQQSRGSWTLGRLKEQRHGRSET